MVYRQRTTVQIVGHDGVRVFRSLLAVDEHDGDMQFIQKGHIEIADGGRRNDDPVDTFFAEHLHGGNLAIPVVAGFAQQDAEPIIEGSLFDTAHDLRCEGVGDGRDDQSQRIRTLPDEAPCHGAWGITHLLRQVTNAFLRLRLHEMAVGQSSGYG